MGDDRGVGPLARIGSGVHRENVKPCGLELRAHLSDRPEVGGRNGVWKRLDGVAREETEEEAASRNNTAGELAQNRWQVIRGKVNNGVPRKNRSCVFVSDPEIAQ